MAKIIIEPEYCKACGLCIAACKKGVIGRGKGTNAMGYHAVEADEGLRGLQALRRGLPGGGH